MSFWFFNGQWSFPHSPDVSLPSAKLAIPLMDLFWAASPYMHWKLRSFSLDLSFLNFLLQKEKKNRRALQSKHRLPKYLLCWLNPILRYLPGPLPGFNRGSVPGHPSCGHRAVLLIKWLAWFSSKRLEIDVSGANDSKTRVIWEDKKIVSTIYSTKSRTFFTCKTVILFRIKFDFF